MGLIAQVLPFAIGAAISPAVLALELLILSGGRRPKSRTWAYLLGFTLALIAFTALLMTVLNRIEASGRTWATVVLAVVVALALILLGLRQLHPKPTAGERHRTWVQTRLQEGGTPTYVLVGIVAMLVDTSTMVLMIPAAHLVARSDAPQPEELAALAVLIGIVLLPLLLPALAVTVLGHHSDRFLAKVNAFTTKHQRTINAVVCFAIAALILFNAFR